MNKLLSIISVATLLTACQKESANSTPPTPTVAPPVVVAKVSISSVSVLEDCPDEKPAAMDEEAPMEQEEKRAMSADEDTGDVDHDYQEPCAQSSIQFSITGQGKKSSKFLVREVRIMGPNDAKLDVIATRSPTAWKDNGYTAWDQGIAPETDVKASYKLTMRNWSTVEKNLGGSSYGPVYVIEADVDIDGVVETIRSGQVIREPMEMIET